MNLCVRCFCYCCCCYYYYYPVRLTDVHHVLNHKSAISGSCIQLYRSALLFAVRCWLLQLLFVCLFVVLSFFMVFKNLIMISENDWCAQIAGWLKVFSYFVPLPAMPLHWQASVEDFESIKQF